MNAHAATPDALARGAAFAAWLRRQPRRNLLLLALVPVLVMMWLPLLKGQARNAPAAAPGAASSAMPADVAAAPLAESAPRAPGPAAIAATAEFEARVKKLIEPYRPRWSGIAAMTTPEPAPQAPAARPDPATWSALVPTMILITRGAEPLAIVQGRTCRVGDNVAGRTIVAIEERRVIYRDGDNTITAAMASSPPGGQR